MARQLPRQALNESSDHDILITLVATVSSNHATLLDKVANLQADMIDVKNGSNTTLSDHEVRLRGMERRWDEQSVEASLAVARQDHAFLADFKSRWRQTLALMIVLGAVLSFLTVNIPVWIKLFTH